MSAILMPVIQIVILKILTNRFLLSNEGENGQNQRSNVVSGHTQKTEQLFQDVQVGKMGWVDKGQNEEETKATFPGHFRLDAELRQDGATV